jgi:hypothetical protein
MLFTAVHSSCEEKCLDCGAELVARGIVDRKDGALICCNCGRVHDALYDWPVVSYECPSAKVNRRTAPRSNIPYQRVYHCNERLAQRNAEDPRVKKRVIRDLGDLWFREKKDARTLPLLEVQNDLRRLGYKKECERAVQCLYRLVCGDPPELEECSDDEATDLPVPDPKNPKRMRRRRGEDRRTAVAPELWPYSFLPPDVLEAFRKNFAVISRAFDELFFKKGSRWTVKCVEYDNFATPESRHNLLHYNYLFRQLHLLYGGEECARAYHAEFFFPIYRTEEVLKKLNASWQRICEHLNIRIRYELHPDTLPTLPTHTPVLGASQQTQHKRQREQANKANEELDDATRLLMQFTHMVPSATSTGTAASSCGGP